VPKQQVRVQQRKIKPKAAQFEPPAPPAKKGGLQARMLEGHSPRTIIRLSTYLAVYQLVLLVLMVALAVVYRDLAMKIEDVIFFLAAIIVPGALVWPALLLARKDQKATPEMYQGQMVGASPVSMVYGLGMLYLNTRQQKVQFNVERKLLKGIPQTQVQVAARVTPNLRHVSSLQVIGPRFGPSIPVEVPEKFKVAERFPLYVIAGAYGAVFGIGLILLLAPFPGNLLFVHVLLVPAGMAVAAVAVRFITSFAQKRLQTSLEGLV
jgi:hypothetical protein